MTEDKNKTPEPDTSDHNKEETLTEEELREKKIQERIAELRKRDPFIYR
jgi:hemerythrin superfamily protein